MPRKATPSSWYAKAAIWPQILVRGSYFSCYEDAFVGSGTRLFMGCWRVRDVYRESGVVLMRGIKIFLGRELVEQS
jgi:hypothetical protein